MKHKGARNRGIAKIHAHLYAVVRMAGTFPERNLDGVAQILIRDRLAVYLQHLTLPRILSRRKILRAEIPGSSAMLPAPAVP